VQVSTVDNLSIEQLARLCRLEQRTIAVDGGRLKLEWGALQAGRLSGAVLAEHDGELLGYMGRYKFGGERTEIAGVIDPQARRRGIGTALLAEALRLGRGTGEQDALLVIRRDIAGGAVLAERFGGTLHHSEHALLLSRRPVDGPTDPATILRTMKAEDWPAVRALLADAFGFVQDAPSTESGDRTLVIERDGAIVGTLRTSRHGERGGIYGFAVAESLRGQGIGRDVLRRACRGLFDAGVPAVGLEVLVENESALGLYTSLGFEPVTTEDYYLLPT